MSSNAWQQVDWRNGRNEVHDFYGVFGTYEYSPQPEAIFSTKEQAEAWIKAERARWLAEEGSAGPDDQFCISLCREGEDGCLWVWNSYEDAPEGLAHG